MAIAAVRSGEALSEEFEELFREHWAPRDFIVIEQVERPAAN